MLATVLTGVRDVRAPIGAGYVWIATAYLAAAPLVRSADPLPGVLVDLNDFAVACPPGVLLAASAFVAYLIGAASLDLSRLLLRLNTTAAQALVRKTNDPALAVSPRLSANETTAPAVRARISDAVERWAGTDGAALSRPGAQQLRAICVDAIRDIEQTFKSNAVGSLDVRTSIANRWLGLQDPSEVLVKISKGLEDRDRAPGDDKTDVATRVTKTVFEGLDRAKLALLTTEPLLHTEIDRLEAESDIRLAIMPPLLALIAVLALRENASCLAGLPIVAMLWHQGVQRRKQRGDLLVEALAIEPAQAPYLRKLEAAAQATVEDVIRRRAEPKPPGMQPPAGLGSED